MRSVSSLASIAVASAAVVPPAAIAKPTNLSTYAPAIAEPDAALLALGRQFSAAAAAELATLHRAWDLLEVNEMPAEPDAARWRAGDYTCGGTLCLDDGEPYSRADVDKIRRYLARRAIPVGGVKRAKEIVAAHDQWIAQRKALRESTGLAAAERDIEVRAALLRQIEDAIIAAPATTLAGLLVKARVVHHCCLYEPGGVDVPEDGTVDIRTVWSIARDLARMNGCG